MGLRAKELADFVLQCEERAFQERESKAERLLRERELLAREQPREFGRSEGMHVESVKIKMPYFEDSDDIDSYISQFERLAKLQGWSQESWAIRLGALLKGKSREVYTGLTDEEASDYSILKNALLLKHRVTAESYRVKFRTSKKEPGESFRRYVAKLQLWLRRWLEMSNRSQNFDELEDLFLMEQLINSVSAELGTFIRERQPKSVQEAADLAQVFVEAHGGQKGSKQGGNQSPGQNVQAGPRKFELVCFHCNQKGHKKTECARWKKEKGKTGVQAVVTTLQFGDKDLAQVEELCKECSCKPVVPKCSASVNGHSVQALRDTGAEMFVVKKSLVDESQKTGEYLNVTLADSSEGEELPLAWVDVQSPFFTGTTKAVLMESPVIDLLIGNKAIGRDGGELSVPVYKTTESAGVAVLTRA
ncbi:hypothetical protein ACOMHN_027750 [Nucella lapillus]